MSLRILIADDSVVFRSQIRAALQGIEGIEVVGAVPNGTLALEKITNEDIDLLVLDLEMPGMNGIEMLRELTKKSLKTKVIVFSAQTREHADLSLEALHLGAADIVAKPSNAQSLDEALAMVRLELVPKILQFLPTVESFGSLKDSLSQPSFSGEKRPQLVVIGCSTGGPSALETLFRDFPKPLQCPILIVQHMPAVFTASLAARLAKLSNQKVEEAKQAEPITNRIYIAPGDYHMRVRLHQGKPTLFLDQGAKRHSVRPAVDCLFESVTTPFSSHVAAFVLTGMGEDGLSGCRAIKQAGGTVMIQNEASCVVFGMPGAIYRDGCYDQMGDLLQIRAMLVEMATSTTLGKVA